MVYNIVIWSCACWSYASTHVTLSDTLDLCHTGLIMSCGLDSLVYFKATCVSTLVIQINALL